VTGNRENIGQGININYSDPFDLIGRQRISLLAIDEAHCISEWGRNFRPNYLKIAQLAKDT
jgi:superfamily II DNA helicase RecQ